ncbi:MAG: endonuclease/exonuclease/phosphatase family protein [Bacteroidetes bacterium]|nr:endonuclease/exonuclease/phosphatase family protein [Bacteroidota bacterium]
MPPQIMEVFKKILRILLIGCCLINGMALSLSVYASKINPYDFWLPALLKLFFPIWFMINIGIALVLFFAMSKRWLIIPLFFVLISILAIAKIISFSTPKTANPNSKTFRMMTYNVMGFDWYVRKKTSFKVLHNIRDAKPDIVVMQEYMMARGDKYKIRDSLENLYGYKYHYEYTTSLVSAHYYFGLAVFSKVPLVHFTPIYFENTDNNGAFYFDAKIGKDSIRFFNVHFESFGLQKSEYSLPGNNDEYVKKINIYKTSFKKLRAGFRRKSVQLQNVMDAMKKSPHKIILCGDFNDTPLSFVYGELTKTLDDTYSKTAFGTGSTFAGKLPFLRIDFILANPALHPIKSTVIKVKASDHYPLVCDFAYE